MQRRNTRGYIREALIRYCFVTVELRSGVYVASRSLNGRSWNDIGDGTREDAGTEKNRIQQASFASR